MERRREGRGGERGEKVKRRREGRGGERGEKVERKREGRGGEEERGERRWREKVIYGQVSSRTTQFGVPRYAHHLVRKRLHNTCQSCTVMQLPNEASQFLWFDETLTAHSNIPN